MVFPNSDGFGGVLDSAGFGWIPSITEKFFAYVAVRMGIMTE